MGILSARTTLWQTQTDQTVCIHHNACPFRHLQQLNSRKPGDGVALCHQLRANHVCQIQHTRLRRSVALCAMQITRLPPPRHPRPIRPGPTGEFSAQNFRTPDSEGANQQKKVPCRTKKKPNPPIRTNEFRKGSRCFFTAELILQPRWRCD